VNTIPSTSRERRGRLWAIVLAGSESRQMQSFLHQWLGQDKPKQYCVLAGTRSMFQHTIDRVSHLIPLERIVVVAARHHQHELYAQIEGRLVGTILFQPKGQATAADVFLPLTYILARDPDATVVVFSADHFVYPEDALLGAVEQAVFASEFMVVQPILIGTIPDDPEVEHGWIQPGRFLSWTGKYPIRSVERLLDKPERQRLGGVEHVGGLRNTMITITKGRRLWQLGCESFPKFMSRFEQLKGAIDTPEEPRVLDFLYAAMPTQNFSAHLLHSASTHFAVMEVRDLMWSDWNHPVRVQRSLQHIGKCPAWEDGVCSRMRDGFPNVTRGG
jgi:mannose-1-phosphate guanylyltransferase